jgi:hypothetical protein
MFTVEFSKEELKEKDLMLNDKDISHKIFSVLAKIAKENNIHDSGMMSYSVEEKTDGTIIFDVKTKSLIL